MGLLYTQLTRRLTAENRLYAGHDFHPKDSGDQCTRGLNYITARPRVEILEDYHQVLTQIYDPAPYCARLERMVGMLKPDQEAAPLPHGRPAPPARN